MVFFLNCDHYMHMFHGDIHYMQKIKLAKLLFLKLMLYKYVST